MTTALNIQKALGEYADPQRVLHTASFFKANTGGYAESDRFLGITVPQCRSVAKQHLDISTTELEKLLKSQWHEERETALFILVAHYKKADTQKRAAIYDFYLAHTSFINNWDLVDLSARDIIGWHVFDHPKHQSDLDRLAASSDLWEKRIAMIATWYFLIKGEPGPTQRVARLLLNDSHDLIRKAVGWMLREMGKRVDRQLLIEFLADTYKTMPRTTLRYAIEHFDPDVRKQYLRGDV